MNPNGTTLELLPWAKLIPLDPKLSGIDLTSDSQIIESITSINKNEAPDNLLIPLNYRIYKDTNGNCWIQDLITNHISTQDTPFNDQKIRKLSAGDKIDFLQQTESGLEQVPSYIFCPIYTQKNQQNHLKNNRAIIQSTEEILNNTLSKVDENLGLEVTCPICYEYIYRCATLIPCLHNFCGSCISKWIKDSDACPQCRQSYTDVKRNSTLNNLIEGLLNRNPYLRKSEEEYQEKDKHDKIKTSYEVIAYPSHDVYEGHLKNQKRHGQGKYTWTNGTVYQGNWVNGKKEGKGYQTWSDGSSYEGSYLENRIEGKGKYTWQSGIVYEGDFVNSRKEGKGKQTWPGGDAYEGEWLNNRIEGRGKYSWSNGNTYEGDFINYRREGKGRQTWADGTVYEGSWFNNNKEKEGEQKWPSGIIYKGNWINNNREGKGKQTWLNGDVYEGEFINNQMKGKGKMTWADGRTYDGDWIDGKRQGKGIQVLSDGRIYEGGWLNDKKNGRGKYTWPDGRTYEGVWVNGKKKHREGKYTWVNGKVFWTEEQKRAKEGCSLF